MYNPFRENYGAVPRHGNVPISKRKDLKFCCKVELKVLFLEENRFYEGLDNL